MSDFYIQWVELLLEKKDLTSAMAIYSKAVANNSLPAEKIRDHLINFKEKYRNEIANFSQKQQVNTIKEILHTK